MKRTLDNFLRNLTVTEQENFLSEIFEISKDNITYHIKNNILYIYCYPKMCIYIFVDKKAKPTIQKNIQTIYISPKNSYQKYKNNQYNNIILLASFLWSNNKKEQTDIITKMQISNVEKIIDIILNNES